MFTSSILFSAALAGELNQPRIVNGDATSIEEWPFIVSVAGTSHFCGASYIGGRFIATAAHCVNDGDTAITIVAGNSNNTLGERVDVANIRLHNDPALPHDFALLELVAEPTSAQAIDLALDQDFAVLVPGDNLAVAGWGTMEDGSLPEWLREAQVAYVSTQTCNEIYKDAVGADAFCAGTLDPNAPADAQDWNGGYGASADSCQGDSGGPIVAKVAGQNKLFGVVSWGVGCGSYYGVYSKIPTQWVEQQRLLSSFGLTYPIEFDFGFALADQQIVRTLTVQNKGTSTQSLPDMNLMGADAASFMVSKGVGCDEIFVGQECDIEVSFTPSQLQTQFSAQISFGDGWLPIELNGQSLTNNAQLYSFSGQSIYTVGDASWSYNTGLFTSGSITDSQETSLIIPLSATGATTLRFDTSVSSESRFDFMNVYVNGELYYRASGSTGWQPLTLPIEAGDSIVEIQYIKDEIERGGFDRVLIANVKIGGVAITPAYQTTQKTVSKKSGLFGFGSLLIMMLIVGRRKI